MDRNEKIKMAEFVRDALLKQGRKSISEEGTCMYRGENGAKCGIGHLISDEVYTHFLEYKSVFNPRIVKAVNQSGIFSVSEEDEGFLQDIQRIHDSFSPDQWQKEFDDLIYRVQIER